MPFGPVVRTRGPHFFVDAVDGDRAVLTGDEARHLTSVLRARPGDPVSLADGSGAVWQARVVATGDPARLALTDRHDVPAPRPRLTVVHALPKGRKLDDVVQRLTEVGVDRLIPVHSERSQVRLTPPKATRAVQRWRAVALAAAKQSRRARPLVVEEVGDWGSAWSDAVAGVVLWEQATTPLRDRLARIDFGDTDALWLAIGPEGGLTTDEVQASGLPAATVGSVILRTETAGLVAASLVLATVGRLG